MKRFAVALQILDKLDAYLAVDVVTATSSDEAIGNCVRYFLGKGRGVGQAIAKEIEPLVGEEESK